MSNKFNWYLIENNSHRMIDFTSEKKLRTYAKEKGYGIKRSYTDMYCFYTVSYEYIPVQ